MRARLISPVGRLKVNYEFAEVATLGRGPGNSLVLESALLSSYHARIGWDEEIGCYRLRDMGSTNGTRLDGARVHADLPLGHLHVITLADRFDFVFQDLERCTARHQAVADKSAAAAAAAVPEVVAASAASTVKENTSTSIGALALALPDLLRGAASEESSQDVTEGTLLERLAIPLPGFLRREKHEEEPAGTPAAGTPAAGTPAAGTPAAGDQTSSPGAGPPDAGASAAGPAAAELPMGDATVTGTDRPKKKFRQPVPPAPTTDMSPDVDWSSVETGSKPLPDPTSDGPEQVDVFFLSAHGPAGTLHFPLRPGQNLVGRSQDCQVRIDSPEVSRHHSLLTLDSGRMRLRDLGSRNKTYVEGNAIGGQDVDLLPGQRLRFGRLELIVGVRSSAPAARKEGPS